MALSTVTLLLMLMYVRSSKKISFKKELKLEARRRRDRLIRRRALQNPTLSKFAVLLGSGCDQSLISLTSFDNHYFHYLLNLFEPFYNRYTPYSHDRQIRERLQTEKRGRPRSVTSSQCLGLVLAWHRTRGADFMLCLLFGITGSVCSLFLRFGRPILLKVLKYDPLARIRMPCPEEVVQCQQALQSKYSTLKDVYCVADGLKLYLEQSGNYIVQNMFYNGWTHDHYVTNVFVFATNGVVIACAIDAPGAMHDSMVAEWGHVYAKLDEAFEKHGGRLVVDSAFSKHHYPFLVKSSQDFVVGSDGTREDMGLCGRLHLPGKPLSGE